MIIKTGQLIKNKYEILKNIGTGGTADIFLCKNLQDDSRVVLKISKSDAKVSSLAERFKLEFDSLSKFNNENIVKVFDYFIWNDKYVIVMEYINGNTLKFEMKNQRMIKPKKAVLYILQILNALKDIHIKKIFHRDLTPANIMLNNENVLKLMDFGIVQASLDQDFTKTGNVIGTIAYMAPEIIRRQRASEQSEIYSLGIVLYSMITGTVPFTGNDLLEVAQKHLHDKPIPPQKLNLEVDKWLSSIVLKMIEKDSFDRYQNAEELIIVLSNYQNLKPNQSDEEIRLLLNLNPEKNEKRRFTFFKKKS